MARLYQQHYALTPGAEDGLKNEVEFDSCGKTPDLDRHAKGIKLLDGILRKENKPQSLSAKAPAWRMKSRSVVCRSYGIGQQGYKIAYRLEES